MQIQGRQFAKYLTHLRIAFGDSSLIVRGRSAPPEPQYFLINNNFIKLILKCIRILVSGDYRDCNKYNMFQKEQYSTNISKFTHKNSPEERSKTPKNHGGQMKFNQRESKSLIKKDEQSQTYLNLGLKMQPIKEFGQNTRYYYLGKGNNHQAIKRALSQRKGLMQTSNSQGVFFKWTQNSFGFKYHKLGKECLCFNHFEFHRQITNKQRLVWNMINFCESNKLNAFNYIPTTFIIDLTTGEQDLALHGFIKFYNRNIPQKYNGTKVHSILLPRSKYTPYLSAQQLHKKSQGNFYCKPTCPKTFFGKSNAYLWILKPTFMNRGRGVSLFSNLSQFQKLIWKYYEGQGLEDYQDKQGIGDLFRLSQNGEETTIKIITDQQGDKNNASKEAKAKDMSSSKKIEQQKSTNESKSQNKIVQQKQDKNNKPNGLRVLSFVVQKYIQCPMLVKQRKFDIRVWALLTQNYEVYFFRQGYLRFSSHKYSTDNHTNPFIHLTNNSVQKHCNEYDQSSGNQISLTQLRQYFPDDATYTRVQTKIRQIIWLSMCSARRKINVNGRKDCFQLFGYDFMIDEAYKVWLIEINTNPAIEQCSSVLKMLIPRMIDDMFKLTIDKIFNLKHNENHEIYPVKGFPNDENMWELLGDFREGVNEKTMGKRMALVRR